MCAPIKSHIHIYIYIYIYSSSMWCVPCSCIQPFAVHSLSVQKKKTNIELSNFVTRKMHQQRTTTTTTTTRATDSPSSSSSPNDTNHQQQKQLDLIIWDVDGTLANTTTLAFEATNEVLKKHNFDEISLEQYEYGSRYTTPKRFSYHACGDSEGHKELGEKLGASFDRYYVELVTRETAGLFSSIRNIVERTKSVKHAALSNACGEYARRVVKVNKLDSIFEMSLGADDVSKAKPEPDGIRELCQKLNVDVSNACYVGDAPSDGRAAKAAGCIFSIGVNWGSHDLSDPTNEEHFDIVCETREELERFFMKALSDN